MAQKREGESEGEFRRRQAKEDRELLAKSKRQQRSDRDEKIQERLDNEAELDAMVADAELDPALKALGLDPAEFRRAFDITEPGETASWDQRDKKILEEFNKTRKQGMFESKKSRNQRVNKWLKRNKSKVEKFSKKHGKKKGWFW
jgi:hypothetical protein